jgi:class 3 adenylate cyclase
MTSADIQIHLERSVAAPAPIVWALVADSNRVDRMLGAGRVGYRFEDAEGERLRIGSGRVVGAESTWVEHGEWVEGDFLLAERRYTSGLLLRAGFRVDVVRAPDAASAHVRMHAWLVPRVMPPNGLVVLEASMRAALERYLEGVALLLGNLPEAPEDAAAARGDEPAGVWARRVLAGRAARGVAEVVPGKSSPTAEDHWSFCTTRFAAAPVDPSVREHLLHYLRTHSDEELRQIRPFELAAAWQDPPRAVLGAFLHAARAGLVDLRWELICPSCRVAAATHDSLGEVQRLAHCEECEVGFDLDFARNVEAVFRVNPSIRKVDARPYCGGSPWWRPHVFARFEVPAATLRRADARLPADLVIRSQRPRAVAGVAGGAGGVCIVVDAHGLRAEPAASGVSIDNRTDREVALTIERARVDAPSVLGVDVMTMAEFHDLFATEAPATGVDLTVGALTVLFSDLTDTTSLYERLGDARAFALVEDHFRRMTAVVRAHEGAVVKTMGDAIMATFASPAHALAAALLMVEETRRTHGDHHLALKVGLHAGPCMAVRANDQLDFFGTTVNLAARLQAQSRGGEIALLEEVLAHPGIAAVLAERTLPVARHRVALKGLREARSIAIIQASSG